MPIDLDCPCGRQLLLEDELAGRRVRCPDCREILRVPDDYVDNFEDEDDWHSEHDEWDDPPRPRPRAPQRRRRSAPNKRSGPKPKRKAAKKNNSGQLSLAAGIGVLVVGVVLIGGVAFLVWDDDIPSGSQGRPTQTNNAPAPPVQPVGPAKLPGEFWVVLSDLRRRSGGGLGGTNTIYTVDYEIVGGAPDPGTSYVLWLGSDGANGQRYVEEYVTFRRRSGTVEIGVSGISPSRMYAYVAKKTGLASLEPVSGKISGGGSSARQPPNR